MSGTFCQDFSFGLWIYMFSNVTFIVKKAILICDVCNQYTNTFDDKNEVDHNPRFKSYSISLKGYL